MFLWVLGFGFLGFFPVFLFPSSSFLSFGVLLYTLCVLELRPSTLLIYESLLIKKKKSKRLLQECMSAIPSIQR
jgi:hypothetical protein